jgi:hypothetical protein
MPEQKLFDEIGNSGLSKFNGVINEEQMRELQGRRGVLTYRKMADYDDTVGAMLFAMTTLLKAASFKWVAAGESPDDIERRDFFESVWKDMSQTWEDVLGDILTMFTYGWSLHEIVLKTREGEHADPARRSQFSDGRVGVRKLAIRAQETLDRWVLGDNDGIDGMVQRTEKGEVTIPIQKALLFRTATTKNNPEGRSLLRNAWQSWYFKGNIRTVEGIGIERDLAGYPNIQLQEGAPDIWNPNDANATRLREVLESSIRNIRRDEQEGSIMPKWAKLELLSSGGKRNFDTGEVITRYDQRICMTVLADFIMIGHDAVGSKALSTTKVSVFTRALSGYGHGICAIINRFLVPKLMRLNGWSAAEPPRLECSNIMNIEIADVVALVKAMSEGGALMFPDPDLERGLMSLIGMPRSAKNEGKAVPLPKRPASGAPELDDDGDVDA